MPDDSFDYSPIRDLDRALILDFAQRTWGEDVAAEVRSKWWLTSDHADATAAIDRASGAIAGMVVAVPSRWPRDGGREVRTVSICGWYVAPDFAGRGLGKLLVRSFDERAPGQNALSISDAAIRNFGKLGWTGPFRTQLLLLPLPMLRRAPKAGAMTVRSFTVRGDALDDELAAALDRIEAGRPEDQLRRRRGAAEWRAHLSVRPTRVQHFHVLSGGGEPVGYFVIRATDAEAGRLYRRARLHYVTDIVLNRRDEAAIDRLVASIAAASPRGAGALLLCTSDAQFGAAARRLGWLSKASLGIGPRLAAKAPLYMLGGELAALPGGGVQMSFADSDVDFNI